MNLKIYDYVYDDQKLSEKRRGGRGQGGGGGGGETKAEEESVVGKDEGSLSLEERETIDWYESRLHRRSIRRSGIPAGR